MYKVIDRSVLGRRLFTITLLNCKIVVDVYPDHYNKHRYNTIEQANKQTVNYPTDMKP